MITRKRLIGLAEAQNWRCAYCAVDMQADYPEDDDAITRDHVEPKCRGGKGNLDNIVVACRGCNGARGDMSAVKFFLLIQNGFKVRRRYRRRRRLEIVNAQTRARRAKRFRVTENRAIWELRA